MPTRSLRLPPSRSHGATSEGLHSTSEARLLLALATADVGSWDWDLAAGRLKWNAAHERICGYEPGTFSGELADFLALVPPEDRAAVEHAIEEARTARTEFMFSCRVRRRNDGALRSVRGRGIFFYDEATGEATHAAGTVVDVTDEHAADTARLRSEERLALALDGAEQAMWEWNGPAGTFHTSARAATMLGYEPGEIGSRVADWRALAHPDAVARIDAALAAHASGAATVIESEHRMRAKDGSWRWVLARGKIVERDASGRPLLAIGT
ncbi:MAG: PAS domain-containing protein, partial [Gemmatimonadaceae bacterium]